MSLSVEQLEQRRQGIGGSDCAAALGLSPWLTQLELYEQKRAGSPFPVSEPNDQMRWGTLLEPVVRQHYSNVTGRTVTVPAQMLVSTPYPFMLANLDGIASSVGAVDRVYEGKTARSAFGWGEPGSDEIPQHIALQVQHYLVVTGLEIADVAVLIGGSDFRIYEIHADLELQGMIVEGEREFWARVQVGDPPEPDFDSPRALEIVKRIYRDVNARTVVADEALEHWRHVYKDAEARMAHYKDACDSAKAHMLYEMKDASRLSFADGVTLQRREIHRRAYSVPETRIIDVRWVSDKS